MIFFKTPPPAVTHFPLVLATDADIFIAFFHSCVPLVPQIRICDECSPFCRLENDAFDEDGNSLSDMGFDSDQIAIRSPPSLNDDAYTLYYPQEKR